MNKTVYIAGKISGMPKDAVIEKFSTASIKLTQQGYNVSNPTPDFTNDNNLEAAMRYKIKAMLKCDELHMLPCWKDSRRARLERDIALRSGMKIIYHSHLETELDQTTIK